MLMDNWLPVLVGVLLCVSALLGGYVWGCRRSGNRARHLRWIVDWIEQKAGALNETADEQSVKDRLAHWLEQERLCAAAHADALAKEIQTDLDLARDFQIAYLNRPYPSVPETHFPGRLRLNFYHRYQAAMALGGDFFDILPLAPDTAGVFVADVMGHGARSALITAILRTLTRDLRSQGRNASHFMSEINNQLCESMRAFPQPLFASAFYFVPDTTSRMATFCTAGHPSPFYIHRATGNVARLQVPPPAGAALGLIPDEKYPGGNVRLIDGDVFLFFTDGVYEASNAAGEEFGLDQMRRVIRANIYKGSRVMVDEMMRAVLSFAADTPLQDDVCMVAVEVTTEAVPTE
jgi:phosphoserine phosphatase RsbU/P